MHRNPWGIVPPCQAISVVPSHKLFHSCGNFFFFINIHTLVWRQEAEVLKKLYPKPCTLINYKNLSVLEWHYPTQYQNKRLGKSHGINTAQCCITSEHTIQHIFILSIPLWGRKVSSSYCSEGCKRDALFIPALQKIYRRNRKILSLQCQLSSFVLPPAWFMMFKFENLIQIIWQSTLTVVNWW